MAISGLEQRLRPLEELYLPFGPLGAPPPCCGLFDPSETPLHLVEQNLRRFRRSRSHGGYRRWRDAEKAGEERPTAQPAAPPAEPRKLEGAFDEVGGQQGEVTTLMLRNISVFLSRAKLMKKVDKLGLAGRYNFVHMPLHFGTQKNQRMAFINFVDWPAARDFADAVRREGPKEWSVHPSHLQGLEALRATMEPSRAGRIRNSKCRPLVIHSAVPAGILPCSA